MIAPTPTFRHAKNRALVSLPDGKTGRLIFLPGGHSQTVNQGRKARVQLHSGAWVSIDPNLLTILEETA